MLKDEKTPGLDVLTPEQAASLRARQGVLSVGPTVEPLSQAESLALAKYKNIRTPRPKHIQAQIKRQIRAQVARLKKAPLLSPPPSAKYYGSPVRIGFDAEWVTLPVAAGGWQNEILCITAVVECGGRRSEYICYPTGPKRSDRPTMAGFIQKVLRHALKESTVPSMPDAVTLYGHFIRGDLASFSDFFARKREFRGLGTTLVSRRAGHLLEIDDVGDRGNDANEAEVDGGGDDKIASPREQQVALRALDGRRFRVRARFVDTIKLTPGRRGLAYAGKMIGLPKLDLHADLGIPEIAATERPECAGMGLRARYGKDRMDLVMRDFPEPTRKYAFQDAKIALGYGIMMEKIARGQFGLNRLPSTLAGCAAAMMREMSGGGAGLAQLFGRIHVIRQFFDEKKRSYRTIKREESSPGLAMYFDFASACYHGGRNECFYHGPTDEGMWYDYDLPGAYTTALVALRPIDYENIRQEFDPDAYGIDDMGLAWVTSEFQRGTRFPCLPVDGAGGALFFPMVGRREDKVYVGAPEIFLARQMGATVTIIQGFIAPWKSSHRIFEGFTRLVQSKRREFPKATHPAINELWKECGNSAYGLMAQGLKEKRAFDPATMQGQKIGPSPLTEPFMAAWATSYIRAVLGEILAGVPASGVVVTATTDGLLTNVPLDQLRLDGPLCAHFADIRERLFGGREVLDPVPKHGAKQLVSVAVRTTFTSKRAEGFELVCAKGSVKPPTRPDPGPQNRYMLRLYLGQFVGMKVAHEQLISAREQLTRESDLYGVRRERLLNLRYDFKRRPVQPRMVCIGRRSKRIAWDTVPWLTVSQAEFARVRAEGWSKDRNRVFKSMADYRDWESYFEASWGVKLACEAAGIRPVQVRGDNSWGLLRRTFLQAGRQGKWGVEFPQRTLSAVAKSLTEAGFPTGKEDITYAGRRNAPLLEHCVPWVPDTAELLRVILRHFPTFEYKMAFRPRDEALDALRPVDTDAGTPV